MKKALSFAIFCFLWVWQSVFAEENVDLIGLWYAKEVSMAGVRINLSDFAMELRAEFMEGSEVEVYIKAPFVMEESSHLRTWERYGDEVLVHGEDGTESYTLHEGKLHYADGMGVEAVLVREQDFRPGFIPAKAKENANLADYNGRWKAKIMEARGLLIPIRSIEPFLDVDIELSIEDSRVSGKLNNTKSFAAAAKWEEGRLHFTVYGEEEDSRFSLQLLEDGLLHFVLLEGKVKFAVYMEKIK